MVKKRVKDYSAEFKTKVVLEALKEEKTQLEVCSEYQIPNSTLSTWTKQFLDTADAVFKTKQIKKNRKMKLKKR